MTKRTGLWTRRSVIVMPIQDPQLPPLLSIIIPAYNEERRLPVSLRKIDAYLSHQPFQAEVLIVENGSSDNPTAVAESVQLHLQQLFLD